MNAPRIVLLSAFLLLAVPVAALAQRKTVVSPGDRVRVIAPAVSPFRIVGTVVEIYADTCILAVEGRASPYSLAFASLTQLEISRGKRSSAGKGALVGAAGGASAGLLIGILAATEEEPCPPCPPDSDWCIPFCYDPPTTIDVGTVALVTLAFAGLGTAFGALIGSQTHKEKWALLPLDELRVDPAPVSADGVGVSISVRWSGRRQ